MVVPLVAAAMLLPGVSSGAALLAGGLRGAGHLVSAGAHRLLAVTLFLMGLGLSRAALRELGVRPLVQAITLWLVLAGATLGAIFYGWIG
jgi:hypothetical protein